MTSVQSGMDRARLPQAPPVRLDPIAVGLHDPRVGLPVTVEVVRQAADAIAVLDFVEQVVRSDLGLRHLVGRVWLAVRRGVGSGVVRDQAGSRGVRSGRAPTTCLSTPSGLRGWAVLSALHWSTDSIATAFRPWSACMTTVSSGAAPTTDGVRATRLTANAMLTIRRMMGSVMASESAPSERAQAAPRQRDRGGDEQPKDEGRRQVQPDTPGGEGEQVDKQVPGGRRALQLDEAVATQLGRPAGQARQVRRAEDHKQRPERHGETDDERCQAPPFVAPLRLPRRSDARRCCTRRAPGAPRLPAPAYASAPSRSTRLATSTPGQ